MPSECFFCLFQPRNKESLHCQNSPFAKHAACFWRADKNNIVAVTYREAQLSGRNDKLSSSHLSLNREGRWGTTDDFATSYLHFSLFSTGTWRTLGLSIPWCCLPTSSSVCLVFPPFHCALQDSFGQTWWTGDMTIPLQFASLYNRQEVFVWSDCLLDLGTDFLVVTNMANCT